MQFQIDRMSNTSEAGVLPLLIEDSESGKSMVLRIPTIPQPYVFLRLNGSSLIGALEAGISQ